MVITPSEVYASPEPGDLDAAFRQLDEVVRRFWLAGRSTRSAAIKQALQLAADGVFDEKQLGFATFREFLRVAEQRGVVRLSPAGRGPDVDVLPPASETGRGGHRAERADRIRSDIWDVFTRWDEGFVRFWDPISRRAFRLPTTPAASETVAETAIRAAWLANPARFTPIEHIPMETLLQWMHSFVQQLPPGIQRAALTAALQARRPVREFTQLVRRLGLAGDWHNEHVRQVRSVVEKWMSDHELEIDLSAEAEPSEDYLQTRADQRRDADLPGLKFDEEALRSRVREYIGKMTFPELLQLPIPLRLLVE